MSKIGHRSAFVKTNGAPLASNPVPRRLVIDARELAAGRPDVGLEPWGSFERWSALVRGAVVFAGLPDPGATRAELRSAADTEANALAALLEGWTKLDPMGSGLTVADVLARVWPTSVGTYAPRDENPHPGVREATAEYRTEEDAIEPFFVECCVFAPDARITRAEMRSAYEAWAKERGEKSTLNFNDFAARLRAKGVNGGNVRNRQAQSVNGWKGVALKPVE